MPDRLAELQRQRALVAEHLAWLDREIATASPTAEASSVPTANPLDPAAILAAASAAKTAPEKTPETTSECDDEIAAKHLPPERQTADIQQDVRRGCLLYFALAALLVIGLCALLVWVSRSYSKSHPPVPPPPQEQFEERQ